VKTLSFKLTDAVIKQMDAQMKRHHFATRTEFIREAIRDKIDRLEKQHFESELRTYFKEKKHELSGHAERITHDVFKELEHRFGN
jgi:Arc/MetJ-type ribon-helix-helix transcriptional regulator